MMLALIAFTVHGYADTWTVVGSAAALNGTTDWAVTNSDNDMTTEDGTNYSLTVTGCTLETGTTYEFKVAKNHDWGEAYPGSNYQFSVGETAVYTVVYTFNATSHDITCTPTKTGAAGVITHEYSLAGDEALLGVNWDPTDTAFDMTTTDDVNYTFVLTGKSLAAGNYEFKVVQDHSWGVAYPSSNYVLNISEDGIYTVTFTFNATTHEVGATPVKTGDMPVAYLCDFNTAITTSDHAFQVASNWRHIVASYTSYYGGVSYPSYSYSATAGVGGSGALSCSTSQSSNSLYDLLVTPVVKGTVTIDAKKTAGYYTALLEFYKITDNGDGTFTRGDQITVDVSAVNVNDFVTITIPVDAAGERIGIRSSYVWLDNFTATEATIIPEKKISFASAVAADGNSGTTGTIQWEQQANGNVLVSYTVTVANTGDVDLTQGETDFSVSIINGSTGDVYGTVAVPQNLAVGETSNPFVVSAEVDPSLWPNSYTYVNMNLKENLFGSVMARAQSTYTAYEPKFVFREAASTATSSISTAEAWGTITASTTKSFEIANTGTAPLTIKSVTLPQGFTSDNAPTAEFTLAKGETQALNITQDASAMGTFSGTLAIVYLDKNNAEQTYNLNFSVMVIGLNTWTADFNGDGTKSTITYPAGSIAEGGISSDNNYSNGKYDVYATGRQGSSYATENNKFITPKLHANAGEDLAFDVKVGYSSSNQWYVKAYVSTDRKNWGDPVAYYTTSATAESEAVGSAFTTKTIHFDTAGDYYVAFALYGQTSAIDNLVGLEKVDVTHDLYIKSVSWPDASIKSGSAQTKPSVDVIPLTDEVAANYTVKYIYGDNEVAIASKSLTASATSTANFAASFTPVVTQTTSFPGTKVVFEFTDGTKFETETFDLTVTNEAIFHFVNSIPSSKWYEPTDRTEPITFPKTNTADTQTFYIYNWGSAPLTVNSISLPTGFTTSVEFPLTVAAMDESNLSASAQALGITFSATAPGDYSGNMVITYSGDQTFSLPISGTKLDPTKWYANFDDGGWPVGSVYQSKVSSSNGGTYSDPNYYITSSSTTDNIFVTPKLTAVSGDKLSFDAKLYDSSSWSEGAVKVYAAATREEVLNTDDTTTRTLLFFASGDDATADATITTDYQTFEVSVPAGDWYLGFEISNRPYVDEIYGLTVAPVAHDLAVASSSIPAEGMQNAEFTASVNVLNLGLADDEATVTAYVDGVAVATSTAVAVPMNHKLNDAGTQLTANFVYAKAGTFPVYLEVKAGDFTVATDPVNVTFAGEEPKSELVIGTPNGTAGDSPLNLNYKNSESVTLYNAQTLSGFGLTAGNKIKKITYKGYKTSDVQTTSLQVYYKWTDDQSLSQPSSTYPYDGTGDMTNVIDEDHTWNKVGSSSELGDMLVLDFTSNPLVYQDGKSLMIYMHSYVDGYKTAYFEKSTISNEFCYERQADNTTISYSWNKKNPAVLHVEIDATAATLSGTVKTSAGVGIDGATVTLKSANGVEYSGTTDNTGAYSFNVIQADLDFTATVEASSYLTREFAYNLNGQSQTLDVTLYQSYGIVGDTGMGLDWNTDAVMTQSTTDPMVFTLEVNNVDVVAGDYKYKLRADGDWGFYELPASGDYTATFPADGKYNLLFTADVATHTLDLEIVAAEYILTETAFENGGNPFVQTKPIAALTVERTFNAGWNAVCLPFVLTQNEITSTFGAGSEVAFFNGDEENGNGGVKIKFDKFENDLEANKPYLIWVATAVTDPVFANKTLVDPNMAELKADAVGTCYDFMGTYVKIGVPAGDMFIKGGQFVTATTNNKVRAFRSYLKKKDGQGARPVSIFIDGEEVSTIVPTGIDSYADDTTIDGNVYNLNGQRVSKTSKRGVYIVNGKKVAVK